MELLRIDLSRVIWLFSIYDFNPTGKSLYPAIPLLVKKYNFKKYPSISEVLNYNDGLKFEDGEYKNSDGALILVTFTVHTDGIVVDTKATTNDSDAFLDEALTYLSESFELPYYSKILREKGYLSQLLVTSNISLDLINPKLKKLTNYLSDNSTSQFEMGGIHIWPDQTPNITFPKFIFERVVGVPFKEKKYFSSAGLQTEEHLNLLNELELLLSN